MFNYLQILDSSESNSSLMVIEILKDKFAYGCCGFFCEMCPTGNGTISKLAFELLKLTKGSYK